jgi:uncharacterized protein YcbK (DUF882 family)
MKPCQTRLAVLAGFERWQSACRGTDHSMSILLPGFPRARRRFRLSILYALIGSSLFLTACTASRSPVAESLETAALTPASEVGAEEDSLETDLMAQEEGAEADDKAGSAHSEVASAVESEIIPVDPGAIPVPVGAEVSSELALSGATFEVTSSQANQAIKDSVSENSSDKLARRTPGAEALIRPTTSPTPTGREGASSVQTASRPADKSSKPSFLEVLFGGNRKKQSATNNNTRKVIEPKPMTTLARAGTPLPGVQTGYSLFGIYEDEKDGDSETSAAIDRNVKLASAGAYGRLISSQGLLLQTDAVQVECLKPELLRILKIVERRYGKPVMVTSGYRSPNRNRRAGGVRNSTHVYCKAADIQVDGVSKWDLSKFLRTVDRRGGVGTYCRTESVHIDVGTQRDWHYPCRRSKTKVKKKT